MKFKFIISFQLIKDMKNLFPLSLLKSFIHLKIYIHSLFLSQLNRPCSFIVSLWPLSLWFTIDPEITSIRSFPVLPTSIVFFICKQKWSDLNLGSSDPEEKIQSLCYLKKKPLLTRLSVRTRGIWTNHKLQKLQALCAAHQKMATFLVSSEVFQNPGKKGPKPLLFQGQKLAWFICKLQETKESFFAMKDILE